MSSPDKLLCIWQHTDGRTDGRTFVFLLGILLCKKGTQQSKKIPNNTYGVSKIGSCWVFSTLSCARTDRRQRSDPYMSPLLRRSDTEMLQLPRANIVFSLSTLVSANATFFL
jgi:hypothetical protein